MSHPILQETQSATITEAQAEDGRELGGYLRVADRNELDAIFGDGCDAEARLEDAIRISTSGCYTVRSKLDGRVALIFGVVPSSEPLAGIVWAMGSDSLQAFSREFLLHCGHWVDRLHESHPVLFNVIDQRNRRHRAWLRWLGFKFIHVHPQWGVGNLPFIEFVRVKPHHYV